MDESKNISVDYSLPVGSRRFNIFSKTVALLTMALGLYVVYILTSVTWETGTGDGSISDIYNLLWVGVPSLIFGGYCLIIAYRAWKGLSAQTVRWWSWIGAILISAILLGPLESYWENSELLLHISVLVLILLAGFLYLLFSKYLMKLLRLQEVVNPRKRERSIKSFMKFTSLFVWLACSQIIQDLLPNGVNNTLLSEDWWKYVNVFAPLILVFLFYSIGLRMLLKGSRQSK